MPTLEGKICSCLSFKPLQYAYRKNGKINLLPYSNTFNIQLVNSIILKISMLTCSLDQQKYSMYFRHQHSCLLMGKLHIELTWVWHQPSSKEVITEPMSHSGQGDSRNRLLLFLAKGHWLAPPFYKVILLCLLVESGQEMSATAGSY